MAANAIIACDPATSWYDFSYSLAWSNECEVAELLSDVPFIAVGILVFAVSVLFFVVKRVSLSAVWLSFSVLFSFVAVVLDLARTLQVADGVAVKTNPIATQAVIRGREVLLAFSVGFRFLFYWTYAAEPPRKALPTQVVQKTKCLILECADKPHSGNWTRWGLPGKLFGVGSLVAIITITALQIVWRVIPQFHQYGNVYGADAALELLVSFLLLLKLLSNTLTFNSCDNILVHTCMECLAPISGLLVKIAIGVGNLLCFAFTESMVGRLLQAFEVYIIVVFVVVTAFLRHRDILLSTTSPQSEIRDDILFTLPEPARGSIFRITPPLIETPRVSMILGTIQNRASSREMFHWSARRSLNHASSWLSSRVSRNRMRSEDEEVRLWNAERDLSCAGNMTTSEPARSSISSTQEFGELLRGPSANINHTSIISTLDAQSGLVRSMKGSIHGDQILHPSRPNDPYHTIPLQTQPALFPGSPGPSLIPSGVKHTENMAENAEISPVYGLSGIESLQSAANSRTSLNELLKQQDQLDRSIEALKLFPTRMSTNSNSVSSPRSGELTRSSSVGQRTVSSEVSLSSFPVPPWLTIPVPLLPSSRPMSVKRTRGRRTRFAAEQPNLIQGAVSAIGIQTPRFNSIPCSPLENESFSVEPENSVGTRYNVTSFIGSLATPSPGVSRQGAQEGAESEPHFQVVQEVSQMLPSPRRLDRLPASPIGTKLSSLTRSSMLSRGNVVNKVSNDRTNNQSSRTSPLGFSPHIPVADHAEAATPTGSRPVGAENLLTVGAAKDADRAQRTFVRPRPPPLVLRSYTEHSPGKPRVQVLADD